ncbi:hypothetical protein CBR64_05745 [Cellulosimicrobium cellulans]|uniref:ABC transporter permease n=1 Tax=Cellulosimicrobium cellulans TaxID=1710 RepID=A0A1Y0HU72_CELCE|nr:hypothetical protein [Cellulosimicrobium cellulans]ARU51066.1 hypothetical protein CBR64_05745 [Cellulosimicrobium cellulans]
MRLRSILRETWRNTSTGTARSVTLALVLTGLVVIASSAEISTVAALERQAAAFRAAGASVLTISAPGRVDGARCESLRDLPGVHAAGALTLRPGESVAAVALPGAPMPVADASPGFASVVGATTDGGPGLILAADAATTLGTTVGDRLATTTGASRLAGTYVYPRDGRRDGYGYLAVGVTGTDAPFDECWVEAWPLTMDLNPLLFTVLRPGGDADDVPQVQQLNPTLGAEFDGAGLYRERVTRFGGLLVGLVAAVVAFVAVRARRVELATALHDGMRRRDLWTIVALESTLWTAPATAVGMALSLAWFGRDGDLLVGAVLGTRVVLSVLVGGATGVVVALATTRERHLFAYAKDR